MPRVSSYSSGTKRLRRHVPAGPSLAKLWRAGDGEGRAFDACQSPMRRGRAHLSLSPEIPCSSSADATLATSFTPEASQDTSPPKPSPSIASTSLQTPGLGEEKDRRSEQQERKSQYLRKLSLSSEAHDIRESADKEGRGG